MRQELVAEYELRDAASKRAAQLDAEVEQLRRQVTAFEKAEVARLAVRQEVTESARACSYY